MTRPLLARVGLWAVLLTSCYLLTSLYPEGLYQGSKLAPMSAAGFLPAPWLVSPSLLDFCKIAFIVSVVFWFIRGSRPQGKLEQWAPWLATCLFTLHMSLYVENVPFWDHQMNLANQLMILYCVAEHFRDEDRYPQWLIPMCRWAIGISYLLSAWAKLSSEGWAWADGTSLQMWLLAIGYPEHWLAAPLIASLPLARNLQMAVLLLELLALASLLWQPARMLCGLGLMLFHLTCLLVFVYINFVGNAILLLVFLVLPETQEANTA